MNSAFDRDLIDNLLGIIDPEQLHTVETKITARKILYFKLSPLQDTLNYNYLKAIHRHLFCDLYPWAGKDRYEMGIAEIFRKGETRFTPTSRVPNVAHDLFDALERENYFQGLDREALTHHLAVFLNGLNLLHPFREGNGRVIRLFGEQLALRAGHPLDLSTHSPSINTQAYILGAQGKLTGIETLIRHGFYKET